MPSQCASWWFTQIIGRIVDRVVLIIRIMAEKVFNRLVRVGLGVFNPRINFFKGVEHRECSLGIKMDIISDCWTNAKTGSEWTGGTTADPGVRWCSGSLAECTLKYLSMHVRDSTISWGVSDRRERSWIPANSTNCPCKLSSRSPASGGVECDSLCKEIGMLGGIAMGSKWIEKKVRSYILLEAPTPYTKCDVQICELCRPPV